MYLKEHGRLDYVAGLSSKTDLASKNLAIWQVLFPAVLSSFCVLWNLAGTLLSAVSVSVFGNLI